MVRTRIRSDQGVDIGFVSEREFNDFFADVVITGTNEDTDIITTFDGYLPSRGIFVGSDGNVVTTGTNTINVAGFYTEFVSSSGTLQGEIDAVIIEQAGIGSITTSGVTITGTVVFESLEGITLIPNDITNTITFSGTSPEIFAGLTDINSETGPSITLVGAGDVTVSTSASNVITISGVPTLFPDDEPENAIVGAGTVVVTSGSNETVISGTPHTINTDTVSDALVAGHGITITSGTDTTLISSFDDTDVDSLTASGVTVTGSVQFETLGGLSVSADAGTDTVTISGGSEVGELIGSLFQIEYTNGGNTSNTWLAVSDSNLSGNRTPWVACFPCRLAGVSFSNRNDGTDLDLELHVARVGDGNTSIIEFIYEVRNARTAFKTDISITTLELEPGDKVSVYASNAGDQGRDVWFGVFWEIISRTTSEGTEDWTGDIT